MRYFVTGATGFVGGVLARKLREQGHEVRASVRDPEKARNLKAVGVEIFRGDVTDKMSMREAMSGVDGVYHVAGWYKVGAHNKSDGEKVNVEGTRNVLELMQELRITKGVYTSTLAVNSDTSGKIVDENYRFTGKHISEYDRTKAAAHDIANEFIANGLPLVIVQPGLIYGPGDTSSVRASLINFLNDRLPMLPLETAYCWAHVDETVDGHILAMEKGKVGESYMICGEPLKLYDAYVIASQVSGKRAPMAVSPRLMKALSVLVTPFDAILPESYTSEGLRIIAGVTYLGDNSKARREFGYNPRPVSEGWAETIQHEMSLIGLKQQ
jgi:nucleoside-diphosphate-sugar epimerase